ncbi:hypothetical protein P7C70_g9552, partial [Phenoliferia sp. Uapishka_3]
MDLSTSTSVASRLSQPIKDVNDLITILTPIATALNLPLPLPLPPTTNSSQIQSTSTSTSTPPPTGSHLIKRQLSLIQSTIITHLYLTWQSQLSSSHHPLLLKHFFIPPTTSTFATQIAISSYSTLNSLLSHSSPTSKSTTGGTPLTHAPTLELVADLLAELTAVYNVNEIYQQIYIGEEEDERKEEMKDQIWERTLKDLVGVPTKVANAAARFLPVRVDIPDQLIWR